MYPEPMLPLASAVSPVCRLVEVVVSHVHVRCGTLNDRLVRQISEPIVSITLSPLGAAGLGGLRRRQAVQRVVGVGDLLARNHVRLRRDLPVVLRRGVVVLNVQRRRPT